MPGAERRQNSSLAYSLQQNLAAAVILVDEQAKTATVISGPPLLLGLKGGAVPGGSLEQLPQPLRIVAREAINLGNPIDGRLVEISAGTKPQVLLRVTAIPFGPGSAASRVVLVLNDLTSVTHFEGRVLQLDRLASLGTLAAGMAHEVKNALVACKTFIDLLLEKNQDAELVQIVRREMGRIDTIVTRTLGFAGRGDVDFSEVHAHEILEHSLRVVERQLEEKAITMTRSFEADSDLVQGNEHELQQAFVNLLLNAVDAMGPRGNLRVATQLETAKLDNNSRTSGASSRHLLIAIEDSGTGIPEEILQHIFEPFVTTKPSGTGLGLAITQQIVQQHRGTITARNRSGDGTTFTIILPAFRPPFERT
jgi:signal transduction histidine kinase